MWEGLCVCMGAGLNSTATDNVCRSALLVMPHTHSGPSFALLLPPPLTLPPSPSNLCLRAFKPWCASRTSWLPYALTLLPSFPSRLRQKVHEPQSSLQPSRLPLCRA